MAARPAIDNGMAIVDRIDEVLRQAVQIGASDVHFEPTETSLLVRLRVDGRLSDFERWPTAITPNVVTRLKVMAGLLTYRTDIPQEGSHRIDGPRPHDLRISTFPTIRQERVVVRMLATSSGPRPLARLGLSDDMTGALREAARSAGGLMLITGPAGSGKTSTLYALVDFIRTASPGLSIITLEDPVEHRIDGVAQIQVTPHGELSFPRAMRSLLRQDPQVIMLGEIRDSETAQIAVQAALTGHLILSSMHAGGVAEALVRLTEMAVPPYQLTSAVRLVTAQRLIRTLCEACAMRELPQPTSEATCAACLGTGMRGRTAIGEFVSMSGPIRKAILEHGDSALIQFAIDSSGEHVSLAADARRHVSAGLTTENEVCNTLGNQQDPQTTPICRQRSSNGTL